MEFNDIENFKFLSKEILIQRTVQTIIVVYSTKSIDFPPREGAKNRRNKKNKTTDFYSSFWFYVSQRVDSRTVGILRK